MSEDEMRAIFLLAGIVVSAHWRLENNYWPRCEEYREMREGSPWWLAQTPFGMVKIGWRKRVIEIDWSATPVRGIVTTHEVTKEETMVHAWSCYRAVEYLTEWRRIAERQAAPVCAPLAEGQP